MKSGTLLSVGTWQASYMGGSSDLKMPSLPERRSSARKVAREFAGDTGDDRLVSVLSCNHQVQEHSLVQEHVWAQAGH